MDKKQRKAWVFFLLACTAKTLTFLPAVFLWGGSIYQNYRPRSFLKFLTQGLSLTALLTPFASWVLLLRVKGVPNPFWTTDWNWSSRYSGSPSLLLQGHYWLRVLNWLSFKGIGPILSLIIIFEVFSLLLRLFKKSNSAFSIQGYAETTLVFWVLSVLPHWLLLRGGNQVHDYYSLPFLIPLGLLSAKRLVQFPRPYAILLGWLSIFFGLFSLSQLKSTETQDGILDPTSFCQQIQMTSDEAS